MTLVDVLVGLAIVVGLAGIIVPVLPGSALVVGALLVWAVATGTGTGWAVFAVATTIVAAGQVVHYLVPHRRLREAGVPSSTLAWGAVTAIVGFFVVPYVGLLLGFVLGVHLAERVRVGALAGASTRHALTAVGVGIMIELAAGALAAMVWTVGLVVT